MNERQGTCCAPSRSAEPRSTDFDGARGGFSLLDSAVPVPGGLTLKGTSKPVLKLDGEDPIRNVRVKDFKISPTTVTNSMFAEFVKDTGYVTEAERFGWSFVFWSDVSDQAPDTEPVPVWIGGAKFQDRCGRPFAVRDQKVNWSQIIRLST